MIDGGLGPAEIAKIRQVNRQLWQRSSLARKIVVKRCLLSDGFSKCETCGEVCPKVAVDHTIKVGDVDGGFLDRLWVSSNEMTGLCKRCHDIKGNCEKAYDRLLEIDEVWKSIDPNAYARACKIVTKQVLGLQRVGAREYDNRMSEAVMEESKVSEEDLIPFDPDIEEMDIWTHEKVKLQEKRNANKKDFNLDDLIGTVIPTPANETLDDLF